MRRLTLLTCIIVLLIVCVLEAGAAPPLGIIAPGQLYAPGLQKQPPSTLRGHVYCATAIPGLCLVGGGTGFTVNYVSLGQAEILVAPPFAARPAYCEVHAGQVNGLGAVVECRITTDSDAPQESLLVECFRIKGNSISVGDFGTSEYFLPDNVDSEFWFQCYQ
jgi:hypothetical protein